MTVQLYRPASHSTRAVGSIDPEVGSAKKPFRHLAVDGRNLVVDCRAGVVEVPGTANAGLQCERGHRRVGGFGGRASQQLGEQSACGIRAGWAKHNKKYRHTEHQSGYALSYYCCGPPVWRNASPTTIAAVTATFNERMPGRMGIYKRRSAARCTGSGTPALSRPNSSTWSAR